MPSAETLSHLTVQDARAVHQRLLAQSLPSVRAYPPVRATQDPTQASLDSFTRNIDANTQVIADCDRCRAELPRLQSALINTARDINQHANHYRRIYDQRMDGLQGAVIMSAIAVGGLFAVFLTPPAWRLVPWSAVATGALGAVSSYVQAWRCDPAAYPQYREWKGLLDENLVLLDDSRARSAALAQEAAAAIRVDERDLEVRRMASRLRESGGVERHESSVVLGNLEIPRRATPSQ